MSDIDDGGTAFPAHFSGSKGLSLRDYLAAKIMDSLIARYGIYDGDASPGLLGKKECKKRERALTFEEIAEYSYGQADEMLRTRRKS